MDLVLSGVILIFMFLIVVIVIFNRKVFNNV